MTKAAMQEYFEEILETTGDLLYRVIIYDRELNNCDEIVALDEAYTAIKKSAWMSSNSVWLGKAIERLERMKARLLTLMEDLLYTA
ncbi:hypothetical protein IDH44_22135 [Paenibacillus sp. IB182496]|uniref:Uncharacterized protein n=1 Tax=Paenibacillus sabuli TaxID=2772509 RepID=A0A927GTJ8_9BACL|nr:hypothetical protein [Paenibacillus sabuli]MBD2847904.1 hypothetical protein [Paenibacillus sabuli]